MQQGARTMIERTQRSQMPEPQQQFIIEMVVSILTYKFITLSRVEVEAMLGITFEQTRVYQEVKEEGRQAGLEEAREDARLKQLHLLQKLWQQRFGSKTIAGRMGLTGLDFDTLTELGEVLWDLESPQAVLQALILDPGSTRVREKVPLQLVAGVLGPMGEAVCGCRH
jgi:predicted transposase YdaD